MVLRLGKAAEAVEALEPLADPGRLAGQAGTLLVQAYQLSKDTERARSCAQVKQYLNLLDMIGGAVLSLSLNQNDMDQCEETIRRITGIMDLYHLETLHPNAAAQFRFQTAVVYAANGRAEEALAALLQFEKCVDRLLETEEIKLHGDSYFNQLDTWIECLPLGSMAPRDKSFIPQSLRNVLSHPAFDSIKEQDGFQRLVKRLTKGGGENA